MLNPSTADADKDDPTIRSCIRLAQKWKCGGIIVVNLFAFRATDPKDLKKAGYPIGLENDEWIRRSVGQCHPIVAAWGVNAEPGRSCFVKRMLREIGVPIQCLGTTKQGMPKHPLFIPASQQLIAFFVGQRITEDAP
jgi:hypothetical protein